MSTMNRCDCGRRHRRMLLPNGAWVTGCPVCLTDPETLVALNELVAAAQRMAASEREEPRL